MIKPLLYFGLSAAVIIWLAALISFSGARFCDKDCADDHSARKSAEVRRGAA
jgi:hypothetical protein